MAASGLVVYLLVSGAGYSPKHIETWLHEGELATLQWLCALFVGALLGLTCLQLQGWHTLGSYDWLGAMRVTCEIPL